MKVDDEGCGEGSGKGSDESLMKVWWRCDEGFGEGNWFDDRQTD